MMSKKDYVRAAEIVRRYAPRDNADIENIVRKEMTDGFIEFFYGDNPNFDVERFRAACETGLVTRDRKSFDMPSGPMGCMKPVK